MRKPEEQEYVTCPNSPSQRHVQPEKVWPAADGSGLNGTVKAHKHSKYWGIKDPDDCVYSGHVRPVERENVKEQKPTNSQLPPMVWGSN